MMAWQWIVGKHAAPRVNAEIKAFALDNGMVEARLKCHHDREDGPRWDFRAENTSNAV
jgi:hypothetical protein